MIHSVLGLFFGFGHSDGFHIAYLDSARWCQRYGHDIAHAGSFKSHKNAFLNDPKCQKQGFLDLGLIDWLDIVYFDRTMFSNILQHYQVMMGHSKTLKMQFWMIQSAKKEDFGRFLDIGL